MKHLPSLVLLILTPFVNFAQISSGKVGDVKEKSVEKTVRAEKAPKAPKGKYVPDEGINDFTIFAGGSYNINMHRLEQNDNAFGKPVGVRADEQLINTWSYQFGVRNRLSKYFSLEIGLSFDSYKTRYQGFAQDLGVDLNYSRNVKTMALPIQGFFTYGKRVQVLAGLGVIPFIPTKKIIETTTSTPTGPHFERVRSMQGLSSFGLGVAFSAGIQYRFWRYSSLYVIPGYTLNLTNVYGKQEPHKEWFNAVNLRFGIAVHLPQKKAKDKEVSREAEGK